MQKVVPPKQIEPHDPIPLVIGVTGHRHLRGEDRHQLELEHKVREFFHGLQKKYSHTPLLLLSAGAEGADRLVARVAVEFNARLIIPLPMPVEMYAQDFRTEESRAEFKNLLDKADRRIDPPNIQGNRQAKFEQGSESRALRYALVGAYIARHSQIILALWDGEPAEKLGGAGQIVAFKRTGEFIKVDRQIQSCLETVPEPFRPRRNPLDPPDVGPVYHILAARAGQSAPSGAVGSVRKLFPIADGRSAKEVGDNGEAEKAYHRIYTRIETFNRDSALIQRGRRLAAQWQENTERLIPANEAQGLSRELQSLRNTYGIADTLALHFQTRTRLTLLTLCVLVFLAAFFVGVYVYLPEHHPESPSTDLVLSNVPPAGEDDTTQQGPAGGHAEHESAESPVGLAIYLFLLAVAECGYLMAKHRDYQNKYQDYRTIAEGLRVQFFWRVQGLQHSVADHYLRKQMTELDWIRDAIRAWAICTPPEPKPRTQLVREHWIKSQGDWFQSAAERHHRRHVVFKYVGFGFLTFSPALAAFEVYRQIAAGAANDRGLLAVLRNIIQHPADILTALSTLFFVVVVLFLVKEVVEEFRREAKEYGKMSFLRKPPIHFAYGFLGGVLVTVLIWAVSHFPFLKHDLLDVMIVAMGMSAVAGALMHYYAEKMAFAEHAKRYKRMKMIFALARKRFWELGPDDPAAGADYIVEELGKEALAENGEWVIMHRERLVERPHV